MMYELQNQSGGKYTNIDRVCWEKIGVFFSSETVLELEKRMRVQYRKIVKIKN